MCDRTILYHRQYTARFNASDSITTMAAIFTLYCISHGLVGETRKEDDGWSFYLIALRSIHDSLLSQRWQSTLHCLSYCQRLVFAIER